MHVRQSFFSITETLERVMQIDSVSTDDRRKLAELVEERKLYCYCSPCDRMTVHSDSHCSECGCRLGFGD